MKLSEAVKQMMKYETAKYLLTDFASYSAYVIRELESCSKCTKTFVFNNGVECFEITICPRSFVDEMMIYRFEGYTTIWAKTNKELVEDVCNRIMVNLEIKEVIY